MFYYENLSCPVCHQLFTADDDIVVCPKCGLPHHRQCWQHIGRCYEEENHDTDRQWSRERSAQSASESEEGAAAVPSRNKHCPYCGSLNIEYAEFCDTCGRPLESADWHSDDERPHQPSVNEYTPHHWQNPSYESQPMQIQGYSTAELNAVVGNNAQYYIPRFQRMAQSGSGGWNWAAFLLGPFWLFYRKQFRLGWLYFVVLMLSNLSFAVVYAPVQFAETEAAYQAAMTALMDSPLFLPVSLLSLVFLVLKILLGIKGNDLYFQFCTRKIDAAKMTTPDLSPAEMSSLGGVSMGLAVLFYVLSSIAIEIATILSM